MLLAFRRLILLWLIYFVVVCLAVSMASPCHCSSAPPAQLLGIARCPLGAKPCLFRSCCCGVPIRSTYRLPLLTMALSYCKSQLLLITQWMHLTCFPTLLLFFSVLHFNFCVWVHVWGRVLHSPCPLQPTYKDLWILYIEYRSSGLVASVFNHQASPRTLSYFLTNVNGNVLFFCMHSYTKSHTSTCLVALISQLTSDTGSNLRHLTNLFLSYAAVFQMQSVAQRDSEGQYRQLFYSCFHVYITDECGLLCGIQSFFCASVNQVSR